jgi:hypothetical protein
MADEDATGYEGIPTEADVERFQLLLELLRSLQTEMRDFSKKKPDAVLSRKKVAILNRVLDQVRDLLKKEPGAAFLDPIDENDPTQNSDAVLILGQYMGAMHDFKTRYHESGELGSLRIDRWTTQEGLRDEEARRAAAEEKVRNEDDDAETDE